MELQQSTVTDFQIHTSLCTPLFKKNTQRQREDSRSLHNESRDTCGIMEFAYMHICAHAHHSLFVSTHDITKGLLIETILKGMCATWEFVVFHSAASRVGS